MNKGVLERASDADIFTCFTGRVADATGYAILPTAELRAIDLSPTTRSVTGRLNGTSGGAFDRLEVRKPSAVAWGTTAAVFDERPAVVSSRRRDRNGMP